MKNSETNIIEVHRHKYIQKVKKLSESSARTAPDILTRYDKAHSPCIIQFTDNKRTVISPLRDILNGVSIIPEVKREAEKHILLRKGARKRQKFRLYKEKELPLFSQSITQVPLNEPGYDNDSETDNEHIKNGIKVLEESLLEALKNYKVNRKIQD